MNLRSVLTLGTATGVTWVIWGPEAGIPVAIMAALAVWARYWPWPGVTLEQPPRLHMWAIPGCTQCATADQPPCDEHGARELAGIPPYHPERVVMRAGWPPELPDIQRRLSDEHSLAEGGAAEQDARTANPSTKGTDR